MRTAQEGCILRSLFALVCLSGVAAGSQLAFRSPQDAADALMAAVESGDYPKFLEIAGSRMAEFWTTGDPVRDSIERGRLLGAMHQGGIRLTGQSAGLQLLYVGSLPQPFPAPLVKTASGWRFDEDAGVQELAARRIRRNEVGVVEMCRRFRDAQLEYQALGSNGDAAFAAKIRSSPGQRDGLFWSAADDESPLGPLFAAAAFAEQDAKEAVRPLFGYYFKILYGQGADAPGGPLDYRTNGRLVKGFALIAWPAVYGVDGFRSFLVNQSGDVYQKDLGPGTAAIAEGTSFYNPGSGWIRVPNYD